MAIPLEDAYDVLHEAILLLGPKRDVSGPVNCSGELALEAARTALEKIQTGLVQQIDRFDPDLTAPYLPPDPDHVDVTVVFVPMLKEHFELIKRLTKHLGESSPEMMAARIITTWVQDNRPD